MLASSTALATLASKISALEETKSACQHNNQDSEPCRDSLVPVLMDVGRRGFLFFSFLAFIISLLAFKRILPFASIFPEPPRSPAMFKGACGTELTVSVSTVMLRVGGSPTLPLVGARFVTELLAIPEIGLLPAGLLSFAGGSAVSRIPPLSLSLSPLPVEVGVLDWLASCESSL